MVFPGVLRGLPGPRLAATPANRPRRSLSSPGVPVPPSVSPPPADILRGMSVTDVAWDLEPLVDGEGEAGADRLLDEAAERTAIFAERYAGPRRRARRRRRSPRPSPSCRRSPSSPAAPATTRCCASASTRRTPRTARCCSASRRRARAIETQLLFFELEWAALRRRARRGAAGRRRPRHRAPLPALRAPLPPAPAHRARGEDPHREVASPARAPGRGCSPSRSPRSRSTLPGEDEPVALDVALARLLSPDRDVRRARRRGRHRRAAARAAHARVHLQHAPGRQGHRRPAAQLPQLARRAQPRQRGERRVGRRRSSRPCATATSCRAAGTA